MRHDAREPGGAAHNSRNTHRNRLFLETERDFIVCDVGRLCKRFAAPCLLELARRYLETDLPGLKELKPAAWSATHRLPPRILPRKRGTRGGDAESPRDGERRGWRPSADRTRHLGRQRPQRHSSSACFNRSAGKICWPTSIRGRILQRLSGTYVAPCRCGTAERRDRENGRVGGRPVREPTVRPLAFCVTPEPGRNCAGMSRRHGCNAHTQATYPCKRWQPATIKNETHIARAAAVSKSAHSWRKSRRGKEDDFRPPRSSEPDREFCEGLSTRSAAIPDWIFGLLVTAASLQLESSRVGARAVPVQATGSSRRSVGGFHLVAAHADIIEEHVNLRGVERRKNVKPHAAAS